MSEFKKPFRPFQVTFSRDKLDDKTVAFTTGVTTADSPTEITTVQTVVKAEHANNPDVVNDVKTDHHNRLVAALSEALRKKLHI